MGDRSGKWKGGLRAGPAGGAPLGESMSLPSAPRLPTAGELYDLDASSLQLKVLQYVSARASPPPPVVLQGPRALLNQIPAPRPPSSHLRSLGEARGWEVGVAPDPRSASPLVPASQLQQETQASRCCLLLVSEDNLQLSCKVRAQVHCGLERGRGTRGPGSPRGTALPTI